MRIQHPNENWSSAYTANVSIGQGYVLATPLQMAMAYATVANGGISYYPRLVDRVLNQDGSPVLDEDGKIAVPQTPKLHADFRTVSPRNRSRSSGTVFGKWSMRPAAPARRADGRRAGRGQDRHRAGLLNGKKDTVAWFCCFAPYDQPRMPSGHGPGRRAWRLGRGAHRHSHPRAHPGVGSGQFEPQLAWVAPARKPNPFEMIKAVKFKESAPGSDGNDEENAVVNSAQPTENADMANAGDAPDVEPEADARGRVANARAKNPSCPLRPSLLRAETPRLF